MDPNANLKEQLEVAGRLMNLDGDEPSFDTDTYEYLCGRLAELVLALDEWLSKGGFLPGRWERK